MDKKIKIVYCLPSLYIAGGVERVLTLKANYLAEQGYHIIIILTDGKNKKNWFELNPSIQVIHLDINFDELWHLPLFKKIITYLKKQRTYKKSLTTCLQRICPDITVSLMRREINFINKIKDGSIKIGEIHVNRKNYRNFDENDSNLIKKILQKWWMKQMIRKVKKLKHFIVLCEEDKQQYPELANINVISNPLSFFPDKVSQCSSKKVIAVGRYEPQKGFDLLLKAWQIVQKEHPDYTLSIYGSGEQKPYQQLANQLNIERSCKLNGPNNNISEKYIESSIFVLSSRFEGFGMVIAEAMACGVPPVSFACPCGPKDIIQDGVDGLLVENGNIEQLAEKICYLIENEDERKQMGLNARKNVARFKIEYIGKQWEELFINTLKS